MQHCAETRLGRFEIVRELARGPNSTVYLARDPEIERTVVIKLFGRGVLTPGELADRVRSVNELSHAGIAKIFDLAFKEPEGDPFLVLEFVEGVPLENILTKGKLSEPEALRLTAELLDALADAHRHGVSHHNLKPSNLIVTPGGHLKVTDFVGGRRNGATPFTAPERLKGSGDARSDLFSVGVILYLMLSGFRPFQGSTEATIGFKLVNQHPVPVAAMDMELSPELDLVIDRFLAKNPDDRYQTADEALQDIERIRKAKEARSAVTLGTQTRGASRDLLETVGFSTGVLRETNNQSASSRRVDWLWHVGIPAAVALASVVALLALRPLMQDVPAVPVLSAHLNVPRLPVKSQSVPAKSHRKKGTREIGDVTAARYVSAPDPPRAEIVAVPVELRQPFRECMMSIWVDEKLTYKNQIHGERKNRFLHMGSSSAEYLTLIEIPAGNHSVRIEVRGVGDSYDATGSLSANFSKANDQKLRITAEKSHPQLDLQLN